MHGKLTTMYKRLLQCPDYSFFLLGPRSTGKSTWLREHLPNALWKNLLLDEDYLSLAGDTSLLRKEVEALPKNSWVVIDEVQKIPSLLNEVHDLIARFGDKYKFAMSGSSARKLRRLDVNLLAGRAIERKMFPLTSKELGQDFSLDFALQFGSLPSVIQRKDFAVDILTAYARTYIKEEIQQEAFVKDIPSFHRFLKVAGIMNSEVVNISSLARDCTVSRTTVERYLDVLVDTLICFRLPGWQPKIKIRERISPKYYFFDVGLVRTLNGSVRDKLSNLEVGSLLETFILHELRSYRDYSNCGGEFYYWRTGSGVEIDFIWTRGDRAVGIEIKASSKWRRGNSRALQELYSLGKLDACYGIYRGEESLKDGDVSVLPCEVFLKKLHEGKIIGAIQET